MTWNSGGQIDLAHEQHEEDGTDNLSTIMALIRPALDTSLAKGTKRQKSSLLKYWGMYCASFNINWQRFGVNPKASDDETREKIRREFMVPSGFASFVVTVPRRAKQVHDSTAQVKRSVGSVRGYYEHMNGRAPGAGLCIDFTRTLRCVTRGLRKLYPSSPTRMVPLLADDMHAAPYGL